MRLASPLAGWGAPPANGWNTRNAPASRNTTNAVTLMPHSQNSASPNDRTLSALIISNAHASTTMAADSGIRGHQNRRYIEAATPSPPIATTAAAQ